MPKAKPDSLQSIRFELQEHERETLNMVAASTAVRNVGQGVGAILDPILDNLVTILGVIIAKEGIEWLLEAFDRAEERNQEEIAEVQTNLYQQYIQNYNELYGPGGTMTSSVAVMHSQSGNVRIMKGSTYSDYVENYEARYGPGTSEYIRLGSQNLPPKLSRTEWEDLYTETLENIPPLLTEEEFVLSLDEDQARWYDLLNPIGTQTIWGQPTSERGYQKAMWWQRNIGRPFRSAGSNWASMLKFW